ncbi:uncharacterized protein LOC118458034 [Anopheles albimanus]|uniref:uncharacterized protein LOC118458034 n=1 Tax=Anopheles albimanus TaxID=7167 RepID=UPI0016403E79|nr:uncharacterized protein LOC118458034 [Anopheles albimanus]
MQDRTVTKQNQKSAYSTPTGGNMKKSVGQTQTTTGDRTKANGGSNGSWGPHFKNREHFNSLHFC